MAHVRRKFLDLMKAHNSPIATEAVQRIAALYLIEWEIKGRSADERRVVRIAPATPLFDDMRRWLEQALTQLTPKSLGYHLKSGHTLSVQNRPTGLA